MKFEKEFKNYVKNLSKNFDYEINDKELDNMFTELFVESGIMNYMLSSKIKDLAYQKVNEKEITNKDMDLEN